MEFNLEEATKNALKGLIKEEIESLINNTNAYALEDYGEGYQANKDGFSGFLDEYIQSVREVCEDACKDVFSELSYKMMQSFDYETSSEQYKAKIEECNEKIEKLEETRNNNRSNWSEEEEKSNWDSLYDSRHEKSTLEQQELMAEFKEFFEGKMLEYNQHYIEEAVDQYTDSIIYGIEQEKSGEELEKFGAWVRENEIIEEIKQCLYDKAEANPYDWDFDEDITDVMTQWLNEKYDSECKEHDNDIDLE